MKVYHRLEEFTSLPYPVVSSGTFDGVHKGHQKILKRLKTIAEANNGETVLITFWPHPRLVLDPELELQLLSTFEEKCDLLAGMGVDHLVKIEFTLEFSRLSSGDFIQQVLVNTIGTKKLVIGYDHRFGRNREGSFEHLMTNSTKYGFEVEEIPREDVDHVGVSSTRIRQALANGNIHIGNEYLGRRYSITGAVVRGDQVGRKIGFPTANIEVASIHKLIPCDGAYAVVIEINAKQYNAMLNIGYRPTVDGSKRTIEAHIFDFEEDIYDSDVTVHFVKLIRKEAKFKSLDLLKAQLAKDRQMAKGILQAENLHYQQ